MVFVCSSLPFFTNISSFYTLALSTTFRRWRLYWITSPCFRRTWTLEYWCSVENAVGDASLFAQENSRDIPIFCCSWVNRSIILQFDAAKVSRVCVLFCLTQMVSWCDIWTGARFNLQGAPSYIWSEKTDDLSAGDRWNGLHLNGCMWTACLT